MTEIDTRQGVLYWCSGHKLLARLTVSIASLREVYKGPLCVLLANVPERYPEVLKEHGIRTKIIDYPAGHKRAQVGKAMLNTWTPFMDTLYIDCDTLVLKDFSGAFAFLKEMPFLVTQYSTWNVKGGGIARRVRAWYEAGLMTDKEFNACYNYPAGINIGFLGFKRDASIFNEWPERAEVALKVDAYIPDEVSCQVLITKHRHKLLPTGYNQPVNRPPGITPDTFMLHAAGRKSMSIEKTRKWGTAIAWRKYFQRMLSEDVLGIREIVDTWHYRAEKRFWEALQKGNEEVWADEGIQ